MRRVLSRTAIDLIVLDLNLPKEDGLALCRELRTTSPIPIIMLTARGEPIDRVLGLDMGADDYLPKPFEPRELLARIRSVLRRTRALPANITNCVSLQRLDEASRESALGREDHSRPTRRLVAARTRLGPPARLAGGPYGARGRRRAA